VESIVSRREIQPARRIPLDAIVRAVSHAWEVRESALQSPSRARLVAEARYAAAYLAMEHGDCTLTQLAAQFKRDISRLSSGAQAIRSALPSDPALRRRIQVAISVMTTGPITQ
jgi:chromosomal replication initiation ATPase DnaA